jgi:23S rRNA pseudouridine1911/1915/1917 synthase
VALRGLVEGRGVLHAARLAFTHPTDGRRLEFAAPLPADLQSVLDEIVATQDPTG